MIYFAGKEQKTSHYPEMTGNTNQFILHIDNIGVLQIVIFSVSSCELRSNHRGMIPHLQ